MCSIAVAGAAPAIASATSSTGGVAATAPATTPPAVPAKPKLVLAPITSKSPNLAYNGPVFVKTVTGSVVPYTHASRPPAEVNTTGGASVGPIQTEGKPQLLVPGQPRPLRERTCGSADGGARVDPADDLGGEPDHRPPVHLRRRPPVLHLARLRLLGNSLVRAPRRKALDGSRGLLGIRNASAPTAPAAGSRSSRTRATPTWTSPACGWTRARPMTRGTSRGPAGARCARRTKASWFATPSASRPRRRLRLRS